MGIFIPILQIIWKHCPQEKSGVTVQVKSDRYPLFLFILYFQDKMPDQIF